MNYEPRKIRLTYQQWLEENEHQDRLYDKARRNKIAIKEVDGQNWLVGQRGGILHLRRGIYYTQLDDRSVIGICVKHRDKPVHIFRLVIGVPARVLMPRLPPEEIKRRLARWNAMQSAMKREETHV